jgi:hypothetical protein
MKPKVKRCNLKGGKYDDGGQVMSKESYEVGDKIRFRDKYRNQEHDGIIDEINERGTYVVGYGSGLTTGIRGVEKEEVIGAYPKVEAKKKRFGLFAEGGGVGKLTEKDFIESKQFVKGNTLIKLKKLSNPNYYRADYIDMSDNQKIGSYGSQYVDDVIHDINTNGGGVGERLMARKGMKVNDIKYSEILSVLRSKIDEAMDDMNTSYESASDYKGEEVEHEYRDGFIPYTDGGYEAVWFETLGSLYGSGTNLPTKPLDDEKDRQIEYNQKVALEQFIENNQELVEQIGEDKIDYHSLYELGYGEEAEELSESEMSYMYEDTIMMRILANYYAPENSRAEDGKHSIRLFGDVNLESPYHRAGNLDDSHEYSFTFNSISELEEEIDKGLSEVISWFNGDMYNDSKREMRVRKMANGGETPIAKNGMKTEKIGESGSKYKVELWKSFEDMREGEKPYKIVYSINEKEIRDLAEENDGASKLYQKRKGKYNNFSTYLEKGGQCMYGLGGRVDDIDSEISTNDLKEELREKMKDGDDVIHFAYTDYGGDFLDKVAIEYFEENYPKNIVSENTAYSGKNAFVFGTPATEWLEASENYLLGFDDIESYYYEKQNEEEYKGFNDFLKDLRMKYAFNKKKVLDWLMENRSGYYSVTTQGLDFSYSDLVEELENEGLIKKSKEYGGGGSIAEGNYHMILSQAKEVKHHVDELQDILKKEDTIEAWVVAKMENVSSTLSDVTHYLDGKSDMPKAKRGMKVDKIEYPSISLKEKDLNEDQTEIFAFIENYEMLNRQMDSIRKNLMTKIARGQFDETKAPKIFMYLIDNGLKTYKKMYGEISLTKKEKEEIANNMVIEFMSEAEQGNYENETFLPKKYLAEDGMFIMTYDIYDEDGELEASGLVAQDVVDYANLIWYYDMLDEDGEEIDDFDVAKDYLEQYDYQIKSNSPKSATNKKKMRRANVK